MMSEEVVHGNGGGIRPSKRIEEEEAFSDGVEIDGLADAIRDGLSGMLVPPGRSGRTLCGYERLVRLLSPTAPTAAAATTTSATASHTSRFDPESEATTVAAVGATLVADVCFTGRVVGCAAGIVFVGAPRSDEVAIFVSAPASAPPCVSTFFATCLGKGFVFALPIPGAVAPPLEGRVSTYCETEASGGLGFGGSAWAGTASQSAARRRTTDERKIGFTAAGTQLRLTNDWLG
jgi:hypothetical protein